MPSMIPTLQMGRNHSISYRYVTAGKNPIVRRELEGIARGGGLGFAATDLEAINFPCA